MKTFTTDIEIRFSDLDAYGHVNNATFFTLLETARVKLFRGRFTEMMKNGLLFLVAEASCRYQQPIGLDDQVQIDILAEKLGRSSFTLGYRMHNGHGVQYAEARTVMVCFDQRQGKPVELPEDFRQAMTKEAEA